MIERDQIVRYCRQELDETEAAEVDAAIRHHPDTFALFEKTIYELVLDSRVDDHLLPAKPDPTIEAMRRLIAQEAEESRKCEWWSIKADHPGELVNLTEGGGTGATVRRMLAVPDKYDPDDVDWREDEFHLTISRLGTGRYRFDADRWPSGYAVRSLRLARFHLPTFASVTGGTLPKHENVRPANLVRETNAAGAEQVLSGSTAADASRNGGAGWLAARSEADNVVLSAREGETEIVLDHERLHVTVETPEDCVLAVVELEYQSDFRGRLPVERCAVVLEGHDEHKRGTVDGLGLPRNVRSDQLRITVRAFEADDVYLLQLPPLRSQFDRILAEQPATSASATAREGGFEVELWTKQYDLAGDAATCWALTVVPSK